MKCLYWRPQKVSRKGLIAIGVLSVVGLALVLRSPVQRVDDQRDVKWAAARMAATLMQEVKQERLRRGLDIDSAIDPTDSGIVGNSMSIVTSRPSDIRSKQTSVNPNFAAAIVDMLTSAGVRPGDTVAVGWSGSFPAFNLSLCAALESLQVNPLIIASAMSSQYGANLPDFMWLDMEGHLRSQGLIRSRSAVVSYGGAADRGLGLADEAREHIDRVAKRNEIPQLLSPRRAQAVSERMKRYNQLADGKPIKAYINVGGGVASTGGEQGKHLFQPGLNRRVDRSAANVNCVMALFAVEGKPVIHLNNAKQLAAELGFPIAPTQIPAVGIGAPFQNQQPNRLLALVVLIGISSALRLCVWSGKGYLGISRLLNQIRPGPQVAMRPLEEQVAGPQLMI